MRRTRSLLALTVVAVVLVAPPARAAVPVLVVDGEGHGHGVGMAQDGAFWMGKAGATTAQILGHFYPGVGMGKGSGDVRVVVLTDDNADVVVTFPNGGEVRSPRDGPQAAGFPMAVAPGGSVRIRHDGMYRVDPPGGTIRARSIGAGDVMPVPTTGSSSTTTTTTTLTPPTTAPTTTTTVPTSGHSIWAVPAKDGTIGVPDRNARYRGVVEASAAGGPLRLVNQLDVEQYLRGMGEVRDPSWPAASLRAQAVAARTYGLRAMRASGEICDTQQCQVYLGQQAEYRAMDAAVTATAGQVLLYRGGFAAAMYSANGAGMSATPREGFGTPDAAHPYLRAAPYTTKSSDPWQVRITLADVAERLDYPGELTAARVSATGPSGRPTEVTLDGSAGPRTMPALDVDDALSLRSTKWKVRIELGEAPPPLTDVAVAQTHPDAIANLLARRSWTPRRDDAGTDEQNATIPWWPFAAAGAIVAAGWRTRRSRPGRPAPRALRRRKD